MRGGTGKRGERRKRREGIELFGRIDRCVLACAGTGCNCGEIK